MRKCRKKCMCSMCADRPSCPRSTRRDKRARRPLAENASQDLLRRAAAILATGWFTVRRLGAALYGEADTSMVARKSREVRARRPVNRLMRLGFAIVRPEQCNGGLTRALEYSVSPEGLEALGC